MFMAAGGADIVPAGAQFVLLAALCAGVPVSGVVGAVIGYRGDFQ